MVRSISIWSPRRFWSFQERKISFEGVLGLTFMINDTTKFNLRNMSAMLFGGPGLSKDGEVRLLRLAERFGKGGNSGDLKLIMVELVSFRDWQRSLGVPEDKLLYLVDFVSFVVDNCNGMTGPRAGLVAKIEQVRSHSIGLFILSVFFSCVGFAFTTTRVQVLVAARNSS